MAVSLIIVSHSAKLAEGVAELAEQMAQGAVTIVPAGGTDDGGLGTSIEKVLHALQQVQSSDGTLVLIDLGSAVMIAEMAIESLDDGFREKIVLSPAPLVEGAILAAVEAASGSDLATVAAAAQEAHALPKMRTA